MSNQVTNTKAVSAYFDQEKAQLPSIRITEQPMSLTKGKINRPGLNFLSIFAKNRQSNLALVLILVLESTGL